MDTFGHLAGIQDSPLTQMGKREWENTLVYRPYNFALKGKASECHVLVNTPMAGIKHCLITKSLKQIKIEIK